MTILGIHTSIGTAINDMLGRFGIKGAAIGLAIDRLTGNSIGALANMRDLYLETALGRGTSGLERRIRSCSLPPFGAMPAPSAMLPFLRPLCGSGYAWGAKEKIDLAPGTSNVPFLGRLLSPRRRAAARFERLLRRNPGARAAFEQMIGGRIVNFGARNDGKFTVRRFAPGCFPACGSAGMLNPYSLTANPFGATTLAGFGNILNGYMSNRAGMGWSFGMLQSPLGGRGAGSWNPLAAPGQIQNTNPMYERAHQAEIDSVLRDPSLTVEDKVTLMIMLIMKKMDQDIERQAQYINSIQQQQSNRGENPLGMGGGKGKGGIFPGAGKGKGGMGLAGPASHANGMDQSPSIDVETMKLKRLIDKRGQMFDMLRQIIDKYNQTAKGIIDSIGR